MTGVSGLENAAGNGNPMLVPAQQSNIDLLAELAVHSVPSAASQDDYRRRLREFLGWTATQGAPALSRATVREYRQVLLDRGLAPNTINQSLAAIKAMVREAMDQGMLGELEGAAVLLVKGVPKRGGSCGRWLTEDQVRKILRSPDAAELIGKRDRAVLALLFGCGLRRSEAVAVKVEDIQQRDGRWAIVDLVRKRGKVHTVPVPGWAYGIIREWLDAAGLTEGPVLRGILPCGKKANGSMSTSQVWRVVEFHSSRIGCKIAPHDARRTAATIWGKAARAKGQTLESVRQQLGHDSIRTTERYLQTATDMENAACDLFDPTA